MHFPYLTIFDNKYARRKQLLLFCPYNLNNIVKSIPGYSWSKSGKGWSFPLRFDKIKEIQDKFNIYGLKISQNVIDFIKESHQVMEDVKLLYEKGDADINVPYAKKLRKYQRVGIKFGLINQNILIADDPGLGKTIEAITIAELSRTGDVLILCPTGARTGWGDEIENWTDASYMVVKGSTAKVKQKRMKADVNYKIMTYQLARVYQDYILSKKWSVLIIDESHNIKNKKTALFELCSKIKADKKILLTANPMMNEIYDMWAQLHILEPAVYSNYWDFVEKYCDFEESYFGRTPIGTRQDRMDELRKELATIMIRREKASVLHELPPKVYLPVYCELNKNHRKLYNDIIKEHKVNLTTTVNIEKDMSKFSVNSVDNGKIIYYCTPEQRNKIMRAYKDLVYFIDGDNYAELSSAILGFRLSNKRYAVCSYANIDHFEAALEMRGNITISSFLERTIKERRLLISPKLIDPSLPAYEPKIDELMAMLPETIKNNKVLIMSQWTDSLGLVANRLDKLNIPYLEFSGRQSSNRNDISKKIFMEDDNYRVMLLSMISGGVALNLQVASIGFRLDKHYNPFVNTQAEDRMHRLRQKKSVLIYDFFIEDTIEQRIEEILKRRMNDYNDVMDQRDIIELLS